MVGRAAGLPGVKKVVVRGLVRGTEEELWPAGGDGLWFARRRWSSKKRSDESVACHEHEKPAGRQRFP